MSNIIIKHGSMQLTVNRKDLIEVEETHDGVVFNIKGGIQLYYANDKMINATKNLIKNTANNFPDKKIVFDLENVRQPAMVDAT